MANMRAGLLVVDVQNGFIQAELPVPGGAEVVPVINALLDRFQVVVASQDWHPAGHGSFASVHPGRAPFELGELGGLPQVLWPDHCVQGTWGAQLHPDLRTEPIQALFRKGMDRTVDSYSMFYDNHRRNPSGLAGFLRERQVRTVYVCGLAFDYCVRYTALDALEVADEVIVLEDACRSVSPVTEAEARAELLGRGVRLQRGL